MDASTIAGGGLVLLSAAAYVWPKFRDKLAASKAGTLPHDHVKSLIDYFTDKKCKKGVDASVTVGKLLYEECTDHVEHTNNLP